jgi:RNA polymerase sigma-70 factor, ECF subfamily
VERYGGFVLGVVKKHVPFQHVEDIIQDVFLKVYRSLSMFENRSSFRHWLSVIAVRTCYDFWREQYKSREFPISSLSEEHEMWLNTAMSEQSDYIFRKKGLEKEAAEILDWALERLSAEDRIVLELVYLEDYSVKETARLLGWSVANVKVRSFRSRKKLHKLIMAMNKGDERRLS